MPGQVCFLKNISKNFDGTPLLQNMNIVLNEDEIHALIGDNGVGKSTLMRILAGFLPYDSGEIIFNGKRAAPYNQYQAIKHGITYIAPDSVCVSDMTVLENMFLADYPVRRRSRVLDHEAAREKATQALGLLDFHVDLDRRLSTMGVAERKIVLMASILCRDSKILILDDVGLGLAELEIENFYRELTTLKSQGVSIFLLTQNLKSVFAIADQITMIDDGMVVWSERNTEEFSDKICQRITVTLDKRAYPRLPARLGEEVLRVENLMNKTALKGVNLALRKGEILGVLGTAGSGRTSLARCLFGLDSSARGETLLFGKHVRLSNPSEANRLRMGFMEEINGAGLIPDMNCIENITLANVKGISRFENMDLKLEKRCAAYFLERLRIEKRKWLLPVKKLSRGEQQKITLSKWLFSGARILLLDEPTQGLDINSRIEVYNLIAELASDGMSFLILSSDIGELANMCNRVFVMRKGLIADELTGDALTVGRLVKSLSS